MENDKPNRRRATLIYDTGAREDDALSRFQWVIPSVFLVSALVLMIATLEWFAPQLPILVFLGVVLVPVGLVLLVKSQGARPRSLAAAVVLVAVFGLPLMAWNVGAYRAATVFVMGDLLSTESLLRASQDRSDLVARLACERALMGEGRDVERRMRGILEYRPSVATRCLLSVEEEKPDLALRVARHLNRHWYEGWMSGEILPEEIGCEAAHAFAQTAVLHQSQGTPELLRCSLSASTPEFAECCGRALSEQADEAAILAVEPHRWSEDLKVPLFRRLIEAVDLPAATLMGTDPVNASLSWTPADLFHWTTHLGCHLMEEHHQVDAIAAHLSGSIETQCGLEVTDPLYSFSSVRFIRRTCEEAVQFDTDRRVDVVEWCEAAREATGVTVVEAAMSAVQRAQNAYGIDELERSISRGGQVVRAQERRRKAQAKRRLDRVMDDKGEDFVTTVQQDGEELRALSESLFGND